MKKTNLICILLLILAIVTRVNAQKDSIIDIHWPIGTFTDQRDGKTYNTVKIGGIWMMAENFAYKPVKGKYWDYKNSEDSVRKYGYLYDWKTAQKISPIGWHLPSKEEFQNVQIFLGGNINKIKKSLENNSVWDYNKSKGGYLYLSNNYYFSVGKEGMFYCSTPNYVFINIGVLYDEGPERHEAYNVRLVKDYSETELWNETKMINSHNAFKAYLNIFPKGIYVDSAKQKISQFIYNEREVKALQLNERANNFSKLKSGLTPKEVLSLLFFEDKINEDRFGGTFVGMGLLPKFDKTESVYTGSVVLDGYSLTFENGKLTNWMISEGEIGKFYGSYKNPYNIDVSTKWILVDNTLSTSSNGGSYTTTTKETGDLFPNLK